MCSVREVIWVSRQIVPDKRFTDKRFMAERVHGQCCVDEIISLLTKIEAGLAQIIPPT